MVSWSTQIYVFVSKVGSWKSKGSTIYITVGIMPRSKRVLLFDMKGFDHHTGLMIAPCLRMLIVLKRLHEVVSLTWYFDSRCDLGMWTIPGFCAMVSPPSTAGVWGGYLCPWMLSIPRRFDLLDVSIVRSTYYGLSWCTSYFGSTCFTFRSTTEFFLVEFWINLVI